MYLKVVIHSPTQIYMEDVQMTKGDCNLPFNWEQGKNMSEHSLKSPKSKGETSYMLEKTIFYY